MGGIAWQYSGVPSFYLLTSRQDAGLILNQAGLLENRSNNLVDQ